MSISDIDASHEKVKEQTNEFEEKVSYIHCYPGKDSGHQFKRRSLASSVLIDPVRSVLRTHATKFIFIGK